MTSFAQKLAGYPIPNNNVGTATRTLCLVIPDDDDYQNAVYGQLTMLGKWWMWKHNDYPPTDSATQSALNWRELFQLNQECLNMGIDDIRWNGCNLEYHLDGVWVNVGPVPAGCIPSGGGGSSVTVSTYQTELTTNKTTASAVFVNVPEAFFTHSFGKQYALVRAYNISLDHTVVARSEVEVFIDGHEAAQPQNAILKSTTAKEFQAFALFQNLTLNTDLTVRLRMKTTAATLTVGAGSVILWEILEWEDTEPIVGPQGPIGPTGPQGPIGPTGPQGPAGADGVDGVCPDCPPQETVPPNNDVPPIPPDYQEPATGEGDTNSRICNASFYTADKLIELIAQVLSDSSTITLEEFLESLLGIGGWEGSLLVTLWDFMIANTNPNLVAEVTAARAVIAEAFFCALMDKQEAMAAINADMTITADAKAAILAALGSVTDSKLSDWRFVGAETYSDDCDEMCNWVVVYDFSSGIYTPLGDEDAIINGDTWEIVANAVYEAGVGYDITGEAANLVAAIKKDLPPQCRIMQTVISGQKGPECGSEILTCYRRNPVEGGVIEEWPTEQITNNFPTEKTFGESGVLPEQQINWKGQFCTPGGIGPAVNEKINYVRITGKGSQPS